jgi:hypothetical protein
MEIITKPYAVIYVDKEGECLKEQDYSPFSLIGSYYKNSGFLQWNYYLIISKKIVEKSENVKLFNGGVDELIKHIENNDKYTRKFVINENDIQSFINSLFPDFKYGENCKGKMYLIKGYNWKDAVINANDKKQTLKSHGIIAMSIGSKYRDISLMETLTEMDKLRALLIKNPEMDVIYYTHIDEEYYLAKKKFKLFIDDEKL